MFRFLIFFTAVSCLVILLGCETENPLCSTNYCITGEIFERSELEDNQTFNELPAAINEERVKSFWTLEVDTEFSPVTVTGQADWDFQSTDWQYRENSVTYLKKLTLEFEADEGRFGENRIILVHLNKDTVRRDEDFVERVEFLGTISVNLTQRIGIATFKGDIVGAPVKE